MTVSVETNKSQLLVYAAGTDQYSWGTFDVPTDADVRVYVFDDSGNGDATLLTLTTHYTVDTVNKRIELTATGHSFIAGLGYANERIAIYRSIDSLTQSSEYTNQGAFLSQSIEDSFDQVYYILQEHSEILKRAIQIDPFDTVIDGYATEEEQRQAVVLPSLDGVTDGIVYFDSTLKQFAISDNVAFTNLSTVATNISDVNTVAADLSGDDTIGVVAADLTGSDTIGDASALVLAGSPGLPFVRGAGDVILATFGTGLSLNTTTGELSLDADLDAVSGLTGTGFLARTGTDAWALRSMTATADRGLTISEPAGVSGNAVFTLAQDIRPSASPTFAGGVFTGDITVNGVTISPSGATLGQVLGFPNSATTLEPYTPAGAGDTLKAANEPITGYWSFPAVTLNSRSAEPTTTAAGQIAYSDGTDSTNGFGTHAGFQVFDGTQWSPLTHAEPLEGYGAGAGRGTAANDQAAFSAAATAGAYVELKAGVTYYMNAGLTPADGFGIHFNPGSKIVLVTGASGFNNFSGAAVDRNSTDGTAFMLTVDDGSFYFTGDVWFEGDNNNQPILRPIYALNCYLYIPERFTVRNLNAVSGALSLNAMRGGYVGDVDVRGNADMVDSAYTNLTNYSPAGIIFDDEGTSRSSRMIFGDVLVADLNRDSGGSDPNESDAVTVGGINKTVRTGTEEGHIFRSIRAKNVGEGFDCFQSNCVVGALICRDMGNYGSKFIHGAQNNVIQYIDVDGFGKAGIVFAGSSASSQHCDGNRIFGGRVAGADAANADAAPIQFLDNSAGTASVPKRNLVINVDLFGEATSNYVIRSNLDATTAGAIASGEENRIINSPNLGATPGTSYALNAEGGVVWDAASEFGDRLQRATATQRGQVELATVAEADAGTDTERAVTPAGLESRFDSLEVTSGATFSDDAASIVFSYNQDTPYATSSGADDVMTLAAYRMRDDGEALVTFMQEIVRGESRAASSHSGRKVYRMFDGASTRDYEIRYGGIYIPSGGVLFNNNTQVVGARIVNANLADTAALTAQTLTDNSGGTASDTIAAIGAIYSQTEVANAIASLADEVNKLRADTAAQKTALDAALSLIRTHGLGATS